MDGHVGRCWTDGGRWVLVHLDWFRLGSATDLPLDLGRICPLPYLVPSPLLDQRLPLLEVTASTATRRETGREGKGGGALSPR